MFALKKIEKKNADWYVVSLVNSAGDLIENVSINRISKKGDVFPNFDDIKQDTKIDGRLWESDSGKQYLFAPKGGAKAPVKQATSTFDKGTNPDYEYTVSEKLETVLNKMVGQGIKLDKILELLEPKNRITNDIEYPVDENPDDMPF